MAGFPWLWQLSLWLPLPLFSCRFSGNISAHGCRTGTIFSAVRKEVRNWLISFGSAAPLVFIFIQSLQVVFAPIPGEATGFLGGYLFGIPKGFLYSTIGLTMGSTVAFLLGRWLEIHFVEKVVKKETLEKFDFIIERQGALLAFLFFLIPGFPKDYLCFILGLSQMPLRVFLDHQYNRPHARNLPVDAAGSKCL